MEDAVDLTGFGDLVAREIAAGARPAQIAELYRLALYARHAAPSEQTLREFRRAESAICLRFGVVTLHAVQVAARRAVARGGRVRGLGRGVCMPRGAISRDDIPRPTTMRRRSACARGRSRPARSTPHTAARNS